MSLMAFFTLSYGNRNNPVPICIEISKEHYCAGFARTLHLQGPWGLYRHAASLQTTSMNLTRISIIDPFLRAFWHMHVMNIPLRNTGALSEAEGRSKALVCCT